MKNKIKKAIGIILLINIFPTLFGLFTLKGKLCYYGKCEDVIPFWGGYEMGITIIGWVALIMGIGYLILKYLIFPDDNQKRNSN